MIDSHVIENLRNYYANHDGELPRDSIYPGGVGQFDQDVHDCVKAFLATQWRDIEQEPPTLAAATEVGKVLGLFPWGVAEIFYRGPWHGAIAWMPYSELPKFKRKEAHDEQPRPKD
jgi:hypothetical protein